MTSDIKLIFVAFIATLLLPCAAGARESAVSRKTVAKISNGFEYCVSTRREQAPSCPMRKTPRVSRAAPPAGIPAGVFHSLAREMDASAAENYDGIESPASWCARIEGRWSGGVHALCTLGSFEQRNFELLTTRASEDGISTYPQLRISIAGVTNYLRHIAEARLQGGFTRLSAAAARAADKASGDIDAGYRAWFASVQAQAEFVSERLEQRMISVSHECLQPTIDGGCEGGSVFQRGWPANSDLLSTLAELGAPAFRPDASQWPHKGMRVSLPADNPQSAGELLAQGWASIAADNYRQHVRELITAAQLTEDRELVDAASEYAAAAMSQVTERAAQCALLCMEAAGLGDKIPVPMPIAADLTIPMTFVR